MKMLAMTLVLCAPLAAQAGGPVLIEEPFEPVPAPAFTPAEKIALAAGLILVGALLFGSGGSDDCICNSDLEGSQCVC
jgi:hypothetical protein